MLLRWQTTGAGVSSLEPGKAPSLNVSHSHMLFSSLICWLVNPRSRLMQLNCMVAILVKLNNTPA